MSFLNAQDQTTPTAPPFFQPQIWPNQQLNPSAPQTAPTPQQWSTAGAITYSCSQPAAVHNPFSDFHHPYSGPGAFREYAQYGQGHNPGYPPVTHTLTSAGSAAPVLTEQNYAPASMTDKEALAQGATHTLSPVFQEKKVPLLKFIEALGVNDAQIKSWAKKANSTLEQKRVFNAAITFWERTDTLGIGHLGNAFRKLPTESFNDATLATIFTTAFDGTRLAQAGSEVNQLRAAVNASQQQLSAAQQQLHQTQCDRDSLQSLLQELREEKESNNRKVTELQAKIAELTLASERSASGTAPVTPSAGGVHLNINVSNTSTAGTAVEPEKTYKAVYPDVIPLDSPLMRPPNLKELGCFDIPGQDPIFITGIIAPHLKPFAVQCNISRHRIDNAFINNPGNAQAATRDCLSAALRYRELRTWHQFFDAAQKVPELSRNVQLHKVAALMGVTFIKSE